MVEEMKVYEVTFDIAGESNYLPGRKFLKHYFRKMKLKKTVGTTRK